MTEEGDVTVGLLIFLGKAGEHGVEGSTSSPASVTLGLDPAMMAPTSQLWLPLSLSSQGQDSDMFWLYLRLRLSQG